VLIGVSSSLDLDASLDEFLVVFGEEFGTSGIIRQEGESQQGTQHRNEAFDDELKASVTG
jgi:hypothetical protein